MIPTSIIGLVLLIGVVLPGAVLIWGYERQTGSFGVSAGDRVLRFIGASAAVHAVAAPGEFWVYSRIDDPLTWPDFWLLWSVVVGLVGVCSRVGSSLGRLHRTRRDRTSHWPWLRNGWLTPSRERALLRYTFGPDPAPRAWDALFSERPNVYLRVRLTDESWVAGVFAKESYAGGHPHAPDLLLEEAWEIDAETQELGARPLGYRLYLPAERIQWIEVVPHVAAPEGRRDA